MSQTQRFLLLSIHTPYLLVPLEHAQALMGIIPDCTPANSRYGKVNEQHKYIYSPADNTVEMKMLSADDVENLEAKLRSDLSSANTNHMGEYDKRRELEKQLEAANNRAEEVSAKNSELGGLATSLLNRITDQAEVIRQHEIRVGIEEGRMYGRPAPEGHQANRRTDRAADSQEQPVATEAARDPIPGADAALVADWQAPTTVLAEGEDVQEVVVLAVDPDAGSSKLDLIPDLTLK